MSDLRVEAVAKALWDEDEAALAVDDPGGYVAVPWERAPNLDREEYRNRAGQLIALADEAHKK